MFERLFNVPFETMRRGEFVFLSRVPVEVWVLVLAGLVATAWWLYRRASPRGGGRAGRLLLALRVAAIVLLVLLLAVPAVRMPRPPNAVFTAVLVDTSRSMSIADAGAGEAKRPRLDAAKEVLAGNPSDGLVARLSRDSQVLLYGFDREAARVADVSALRAEGSATDIFRAVRDMESELRGLPLAAVVMLTDGCRNEGGSPEEAAKLLKARRVPLHVVGLGDPSPPKDFEVVRVFAPKRVRRNTEVEVYATVRHTDFHEPFELEISRAGTRLLSKTIDPGQGGDDLKRVRFAFTPDIEGTATYRVSVPAGDGERITDNNSREFVLEIQDDRLPVLYIEGSPRLEYRFLRRALFRDPDFRLVGLLRLASDRFYVQGANESERYLEAGFPNASDARARERLFAFEAIILGDIEAGYFTPAQLALVEEFVRVRGGGLLMLGGVNSFGLGGYAGTPVGKMLPLDVSPSDPPYEDGRYQARATEEGLAHPVMRLVSDAEANARLWAKAPPLVGITPVRRVKPAAQVLLAREDGGLPVLAVQPYGQGRAAAFTSGGSWYWQVSMPASDEFHEKFWKQLVRWLAVGATERLTAGTDADVYPRGRAVFLRATALQKDLRPVNDATLLATVTDPLGNTEEVPMDWILSEEGVYQCRYVPADEGNYGVSVRVQGWDLPPAETAFEVSEPFVEFSSAGLKEETLRGMARTTGGRYWRPDEAGALADAVARQARSVTETTVKPVDREIWDTPLLFALLVAAMAAEWFVRRRTGLA